MPIWRDKREKKRGRARSSSPGRRTDRPGRGSHHQSTTDHQSPTSRTGYSAPGIYLPSTKPVDLTFLGVEITWYRVSKIPALVEVFPSRGRDSLTWEFSSHRFSLREIWAGLEVERLLFLPGKPLQWEFFTLYRFMTTLWFRGPTLSLFPTLLRQYNDESCPLAHYVW